MKHPRIAVCLTINDRPRQVLEAVFESLSRQSYDQLIVVFDRTPKPLREWCESFWSRFKRDARMESVEIAGPAAWRCPAKAWNTAFDRVNSELTFVLSSETIQGRDNVELARDILKDKPGVLFGKAECSCGPDGEEVNWGGTAPGNLLTDAAHPRPLGFVMCLPTWMIRATGGMDEGFMAGWWYDDDDWMYRLWQLGQPFYFDDSVTGLHQHHDRPVLASAEGAEGIERNRRYIVSKWGMERPLSSCRVQLEKGNGATVMRPVLDSQRHGSILTA